MKPRPIIAPDGYRLAGDEHRGPDILDTVEFELPARSDAAAEDRLLDLLERLVYGDAAG